MPDARLPRYFVAPIATAACDSIVDDYDSVVLRTNDVEQARIAARGGSNVYGRGILDRATGELDVGFGFGVACPDIIEED
jgi:hypothetical protein